MISFDFEKYVTETHRINERGPVMEQIRQERSLSQLRRDGEFRSMVQARNQQEGRNDMMTSVRQGNIGELRQSIRGNMMKSMRLNETTECTICQMDFVAPCQITTLKCFANHFFHKECLEAWTKSLETRRLPINCPNCRAAYDPHNLENREYKGVADPVAEAKMDKINEVEEAFGLPSPSVRPGTTGEPQVHRPEASG